MTDAVRTELGQSSVIALLAPARVANALRRMERPLTAHVTSTLAREIAEREGVKAVVEGNVTAVGTGYIVTLRLVSADSGMELASFRETGEGPRGLIDAADKLARRLRGRIGESLRSVQASTPLAQATTSSLEALRKYSEAWRANTIEGNPARAIKIAREAVAIDSTFASAWRLLSVVLGNTGQRGAAHDSAVTRAYQYRNRLPEIERLRVEAYYYLEGPHADRTKAIAAHEQAIERGDTLSANNLGEIYRSRRDYARADAAYRLLMAKQPDFALAYYNAIEMALNQGKQAAAESLLTASIKIAGNVRGTTVRRFALAYAKYGPDSARHVLDSIPNDPSLGPFIPYRRSALAILGGRLAESRRLIAEWRPRDRPPMTALNDSISDISLDAWFFGPSDSEVRRLDAAVARYPWTAGPILDRPYFFVAGAYALAGRPDKAKQVIADYRAQVTDTALLRRQATQLHDALGEIALAERKPQVAITEFKASDVDYDGFPPEECGPCIMIKLARAYDAAEQADSAIAYYERFVETPYWFRANIDVDPIFLAGAHKRLGELYEAKDNRTKAVSHYSKFVELWKNADPELQPRVAEVRRRLSRLGREEP
jgi:tetratricopeptide (TPR) repeat protein